MIQPKIDLLLPGLLGPFPEGFLPPRLPALEALLARADRADAAGFDLASTLCGLFGIPKPADGDLPIGPLCRLADSEADNLPRAPKPTGGYTLLATPVHLRPDQDRLLLFPATDVGIARQEADELVELFNGHFVGRGLRLIAPQPGRWYLIADDTPRLQTIPLEAVSGRNIARALPEGPDGRRWHVLLNEIQMLFHQASLNDLREAQGQPVINGLWLHGGGALPEQVHSPYTAVWSDHPLARGLARLQGIEPIAVAAFDRSVKRKFDTPGQADSRWLLVADQLDPLRQTGDPSAWAEAATRLDRNLIAPLLTGLRQGAIGGIDLYPCNGVRLTLTKGDLWRFWRLPRPLSAWG